MIGPGRPPTSVAVYVCTYRRNEPLRRLLDSLEVAAKAVSGVATVGVVVVDDNVDGRARTVVDDFSAETDAFGLGLHYRHSGSGNISTARNIGLEAAAELADWVAMTDDDCVVEPQWLQALLDVQQRRGVLAVTGPMKLRFAPGSPRWLDDEPFAQLGSFGDIDDAALVELCATNNSLISSAFVREHPDVRFDPSLGRLGGEDMVFYRRARQQGLTAAYSADGVVWGEESEERSTFAYQMRQAWWLGNTEYVTNFTTGDATRLRLIGRGAKRLPAALVRPAVRGARGQNPQLRYALAQLLRSAGLISGGFGIRVEHK